MVFYSVNGVSRADHLQRDGDAGSQSLWADEDADAFHAGMVYRIGARGEVLWDTVFAR